MRNHEWSDLHEVIVATAGSLFSSVGIRANYCGIVPHGQAPWSGMVAVIGLGGSKLRGTLVLSMSDELLLRSHPARGACDADLADWLSEQANLLLGRIKARLLAHDVVVELSTPLCVAAAEFRLMRFGSTPCVHRYDCEGRDILVAFESVAGEGTGLLVPARADAVVIEAGEVLMF